MARPTLDEIYGSAAKPSLDEIYASQVAPRPSGALPKKKDPNASWLGTNLAKGWETGREVIGGLQRFAGDEEGGLSTIAKSEDRMAQLEADIPSMQSGDVTGVGTGLKFVGEQILKNAALAVPSVVGGAAAVLSAPVSAPSALAAGGLAAAGAFLPSLAIETGIVSADSDKIDGNRGRILKGAVPAAALDAASSAVSMGAGGLTKMLRRPATAVGTDLLAPTVKKSLTVRAAKATGALAGASAEEGVTEGAQTPLETWGAGKQVFKEGKAFGDDLLGNTAAAISGGLFGTKENYTDEMQEEIRESAIGGAAAGFGMAGGTKVLTKSAEAGKEYLDGRTERVLAAQKEEQAQTLQELKAETDASVIVAGAREKVVAEQQATFTEAKAEQAKELAAELPKIKADINNQEATFTEANEETVRSILDNPVDEKTYAEASTVLTKGLKSREQAVTDGDKAVVESNKKDIGHLSNSLKANPYDVDTETALLDLARSEDPMVAGKASSVLQKLPSLREAADKQAKADELKVEQTQAKEADAIESKRKGAEQTLRDAQRVDVKHDTKIAQHAAKLTALYSKKNEASTPEQRAAITIQIEAEKKQLEISKQERFLSRGETVSARQELAPTRSVITDMMGGQQIYEAVVNHKTFHKIASAAKNYLDYAKQMIAAFGKRVEAHLKDLWAYAKKTLQSERGSVSFKDAEQHAANLAEDRWTDESAPTEEEYSESISFDNDLDEEGSLSFDNDLDMKPEYDDSKNMLVNEEVGAGRSAATLLAERKEKNRARLIRKEKLDYKAPKAKDEIRANRASKNEEPNGVAMQERLIQSNSDEATGQYNQREYINEEGELYENEHDDDTASSYDKANKGKNAQANGKAASIKESGISDVAAVFGSRFSSVEKNKEGSRKPGYEKNESPELKAAREAIAGSAKETPYRAQQKKVVNKIIAQLRDNKALSDYTVEYILINGIQDVATKNEDAMFELPPGASIPKVLADELNPSEYTVDKSATTLRQHLELVADTYDMESMYRFLLKEYKNETGRYATSFASMDELPSALLAALDAIESDVTKAEAKAETVINELRDSGMSSVEIANTFKLVNSDPEMSAAMETIGLDKAVAMDGLELAGFLDAYFARKDAETVNSTKSIGHLVNRGGTITLPDGREFNTKSTNSISSFMNTKEARKALKAIEFSPSELDVIEGNNTSANPEPKIKISKYREDDSYDDMAKEKNWSNDDLYGEARANVALKPVDKERAAAEQYRLDKQYEGFKRAFKLNQNYPAVVKALYTAADKIMMDKEGDKALTQANILAYFENVIYHSKFGDFSVEQRQYERMTDENKTDLVEMFLGQQIYKIRGEENEWHTRGEFDGEGLTEYTERLKEKNQLGMALEDDYDETIIDPIVYSTRGVSTLPVRNDFRSKGTDHGLTGSKLDTRHDRTNLTELHDLAMASIPEYEKVGMYANSLMLMRFAFEYKMNLFRGVERLQAVIDSIRASHAKQESVTAGQKESANKLLQQLVAVKKQIASNEASFPADVAKAEARVKVFDKRSNGLKINEMIAKEKTKTEKSVVRYSERVVVEKARLAKLEATDPLGADTVKAKEQLANSSRILADQQRRLDSSYAIQAQAAIQALEYKINDQMVKARALLAKKSFIESSVREATLFDNVANGYNQLLPEGAKQLTAAEAYDVFLQSGSDLGIFRARINLMSDQAYNDAVVEAYGEAMKTAQALKKNGTADVVSIVRPIITARLSAKDKLAYEKLAKGERLPRRTQYKLKALYAVEQHIAAIDHIKPEKRMVFDRDMTLNPADKKAVAERKKQRVADVLQKQLDLAVEADFVKEKQKATSVEQQIIDTYPGSNLRAVTINGNILNIFFGKVAKMFGADLVTVAGDHTFKGAYIPAAADGRPKIVINVTKGSIARIFAHELFHHVLNKLDAGAYASFRTAIKENIDKDKWAAAIERVGRSMFPQLTTTEFSDITTNAMNANPMSRLTSGGALKKSGVTNRHEPAGYYEKKSDGNFNHNPLADKSLDYVSAENDLRRPVGQTATTTFNFSEADIEAIENELYAELFAQAIHKRGFWDALAKTFEGRSIAAMIMVRSAQMSEKLVSLIAASPRAHMDNAVIRELVTNWHKDGGVNSILINALGESRQRTALRDSLSRNHTTVNEEVVRETKALYASGRAKLDSTYTTVFPKGSRSYKDVMTAIEKWLDSVVQWIAKHKPAGLFADFYLDEEIRAFGNQIIHSGQALKQEAYNRVVVKHKEAFKGMNPEALGDLYQRVIREPNKYKRAKAFNSLPAPQKEAFLAMKAVTDKVNAGLVKRGIVPPDHEFVDYGQAMRLLHKDVAIDDSIDASLRDMDSQIEKSPRFTKKNLSKKTLEQLKEQGITPQTVDPMHMFLNYVVGVSEIIGLHDTIKEGMSKGYVRHAFSAGMVVVDDPAFSVVLKHEGAKFRILVAGKPLLINGGEAVFDSAEKADEALTAYQDEIAIQHSETFTGPPAGEVKGTIEEIVEENRSYMNVSHYEIRRERNFAGTDEPAAWEFVDSRTVATREEADSVAASAAPDERIAIRPVFAQAEVKSDSKLYFTKDFAKLINVILSKDTLREAAFGPISGEKIMKIKNGMTMLEMSFSAFHAFTIGQEMISSNAAWHKGRKGSWSLKSFNPIEGKKAAFEISALMNKVITDNAYADTAEGKAELKRLLGSDSVDAVDIYHQFFGNGGLFHMDDSLKSGMESFGEMNYEGFSGFIDDMHGTLEKQRLAHPNSPITAFSKTLLHTTLRGSSAWLMEKGIPKIKFAAFCREYSLKVDQDTAKLGRPLTAGEKSLLARNTMYFIEDRFGEVNWKNMWLNKSYKTALQFAFRSFTWVAGSWVALTKAGIDIAKLGWFTLKGEEYTLTERGYWGVAALAAHAMTAASVGAIFGIFAAAAGEEAEETDEATPFLTRMLFPRVDPYDNTKRIGIPSYVTEAYKIFSHLGLTGESFEPEKLISGRFNSLVGNTVSLIKGEDFRGVLIRNPEDSMLGQAYDVAQHMLVSPIVFSNIYKNYQAEGFNAKNIPMSLMGFSDAPAFAKRSHATNLAFDLSRREYKGREMTEDEMDLKDDLKKAMNAYVRGDKTKVDEMLAEGKVSERAYKIALTRYPVLNNEPNPRYKNPLSQVLGRLTVKSALKVYEEMTDEEKVTHLPEMNKKLNNMKIRKDVPKEQQDKFLGKWDELQSVG